MPSGKSIAIGVAIVVVVGLVAALIYTSMYSSPPAFALIKASWGTGTSVMDVTAKIAALLDANGNFTSQPITGTPANVANAYNVYFGNDPAYGYDKCLLIVYQRQGVQHIIAFGQDTFALSLP